MKKILLIEDNDGDQLLIKEALSETDIQHELSTVSTGEDGIAQLDLFKPDIVIADTNLPGMDGFEVCQKIKDLRGDAVKVIVMTGVVDAVDAGRALESGADDYCVKTVGCESLVNALRSGPASEVVVKVKKNIEE
jgi:DNA-binding response OmpR family regulator